MSDCQHDYFNPNRKGRARYHCPMCDKDISLEVVLLAEHDMESKPAPAQEPAQIETPLTDALWNGSEVCSPTKLLKHARQLEHKLAAAHKREQRLREALGVAAKRFRDPQFGCVWIDAAEALEQALAETENPQGQQP